MDLRGGPALSRDRKNVGLGLRVTRTEQRWHLLVGQQAMRSLPCCMSKQGILRLFRFVRCVIQFISAEPSSSSLQRSNDVSFKSSFPPRCVEPYSVVGQFRCEYHHHRCRLRGTESVENEVRTNTKKCRWEMETWRLRSADAPPPPPGRSVLHDVVCHTYIHIYVVLDDIPYVCRAVVF